MDLKILTPNSVVNLFITTTCPICQWKREVIKEIENGETTEYFIRSTYHFLVCKKCGYKTEVHFQRDYADKKVFPKGIPF